MCVYPWGPPTDMTITARTGDRPTGASSIAMGLYALLGGAVAGGGGGGGVVLVGPVNQQAPPPLLGLI